MKNQTRMGVPPRRENIFFVHSPKAEEKFKFAIYSAVIDPLYTHYNGKVTVPCYLDRSLCDPKHSLLNLRWKGYVFGFDFGRNNLGFLQLTHEAANMLLDQLEGPQALRGLTVDVCRTKKRNGRMLVHVDMYKPAFDLSRTRQAPPVRRSFFNLCQLEYNDHPFTTCVEDLEGPAETIQFPA